MRIGGDRATERRMGAGRRRGVVLLAAAVLALSFDARPAAACPDLSSARSTRWSIAAEHGVSWLVTPCGQRFFSLGVNALDGGYPFRRKAGKIYYSWKAFTPTFEDWVSQTRRRLGAWGFNSAGGWALPPQQLKLPTIIDLELGRLARYHWFDPFAPATARRMTTIARRLVRPYRNTPYRIGYFSDNEVGWWGGALFIFYSMQPAGSATKQRWVAMLRHYYDGRWSRFVADFEPPARVASWRALLAAKGMTRLRPGSAGIHAVDRWTGILAHHYYKLAAAAIHAADPDALYFGDRLPIYYDPAAVRAMAPYVDAIATNYNVDASDGWIARYFFDGLRKLSGGKPVLISEWFFAARHNRTGNRNNGHLMTVDTQAQRAAGAAAATLNMAAIGEVIGAHWFQYYDHPKGGRPDGEDYDFGLVDINDQPYRRLTAALAAADRAVPHVHAAARLYPPENRRFVVPEARVALRAHSLSGWPKPASLLPPLAASPGAVEFGEVYLTWSRRGLALATIGQDYYDLDLLAYRGFFPLVDAYKVELGVDLGADPRRFTLFFIPPKKKRRDFPHLTALLCAGRAERAERNGCTAVRGAQAVYFGADQPRITAEMRIPWSALGSVATPRPGMRLSVEVAVTAWERDRWMSLSGKPPGPAMQAVNGWREMRLGDGVQMIERRPATAAGRPG